MPVAGWSTSLAPAIVQAVGSTTDALGTSSDPPFSPASQQLYRPSYHLGRVGPFRLHPESDHTGAQMPADHRRHVMGSKLYVGNLSYNVNSSDLEQLFNQHGTVQSAEVIADRDTGRSKGFGFVQMGTNEEAQAAINALNGQEHDGRALTVNEAKPKEDRPRGGGGYGRGGGGGQRGGYSGGGGGRSRY